MSANKYYRQQWIALVYAEAVQLFHEARKAEGEPMSLADLARACTNTAFAERADQIIGDKETMARAYLKHCRDNFDTEIALALAAKTQPAILSQQAKEHSYAN